MEPSLPVDQTSEANKAKIYNFIIEQKVEELDELLSSENILPHEELSKGSGWTAFHWAAHANKKVSLEFLLKYTYKHHRDELESIIQTLNTDGMTPLMVAAIYGSKECFNLLNDAGGIDLDLKNNEGFTVKDLAIQYGHKHFEERVNRHASPLVPINHEFFNGPQSKAEKKEEIKEIEAAKSTAKTAVLEDKVKPAIKINYAISSQIHASIAALDLSKFRRLVEENDPEPNEDLSRSSGWTAFHYAAFHNAPKIIEYLIKRTYKKYKADGLVKFLALETNDGKTPVLVCCTYKAAEALKMFYQYGGFDPTKKDNIKYDALQYAKHYQSKECEEIILRHPQNKFIPVNENLFSGSINNTKHTIDALQGLASAAMANTTMAGSKGTKGQDGIELKDLGQEDSQPSLESLKTKIEDGFKRLHIKSLTTSFPAVKTIAVSKNGKNVAVGGNGNVILNYDTQMNTLLKLECTSDANALAVGDDNDVIVSGFKDGCIGWHNIAQQKTIFQIKAAHTAPILALAVSGDLKLSYSGDNSGNTKVYDLETKEKLAEFDFHDKAPVRAVAVSRDKKFAVSGDDDIAIAIINLEDFTLIKKERLFHNDIINGIKITSDNKKVITCSADGTIGLYNLQTLQLEKNLTSAHTGSINSIALTDNNRFLFSGSSDSSVGIVDLKSQEVIYNFKQNLTRRDVSAVGVSGDGRFLAVGTNSANLEVFDLYEGTSTKSYEAHTTGVLSLYITSSKQYVFAGAKDGSIAVIYLPSNELIENKRVHNGPVTSIAMTPDEEFLVSASGDTTLCISALENDRLEIKEKILGFHQSPISSIEITSGGRLLVSADEHGLIVVTDLKTKLKLFELNNSKLEVPAQGSIKAIKVSSDGSILYAGSIDSKVVRYSLADRKILDTINLAITHKITSLALSRDEQIIYTGAGDGSVYVYDQIKGEVIRRFQSLHKNAITKIVVSSDGRYVFTSSRDSTVGIFDTYTLKPISSLKDIHKGAIQTLAISYDNKILLTGGEDARVSKVQNIVYNEYCILDRIGSKLDLPASFREMLFVKTLEPNEPSQLKTLIQYPRLIIYPIRWNWLHIFCMLEQCSEQLILECIKIHVPFIADSFGKTALHYLMNSPKIDGVKLDLILANFGKMVHRKCIDDRIFPAMKDIFLPILALDNPNVALYLKQCVNYPPTYKNELIPRFGDLKGTRTRCFYTSPSPLFTADVKNQLLDVGGSKLLAIYFFRIPWDFRAGSKEFLDLVSPLEQCNTPEIFQTRTISAIVDQAWVMARLTVKFSFLTFTINIIILSLFVLLTRGNDYELTYWGGIFGAVTLGFGALSTFYEFGLMMEGGATYFSSLWNWLSLIGGLLQCLLPVVISTGILPADSDSNITALQTLFCWCILFRYLKWFTFLKIFDKTRTFIKMLTEVMYDMVGFASVTALVLAGTSIIFYVVFDIDDDHKTYFGMFFHQMFNVYGFLIGSMDSEGYAGIQILIFIILTIFLSLVLLNMLIAHMGTTYSRVQEQGVFFESKDKLSLIKETFTLTRSRLYLRCQRQIYDSLTESSYLFCAQEGLENLDQQAEDNEGLNLLRRELLLKLEEVNDKIQGNEKDSHKANHHHKQHKH